MKNKFYELSTNNTTAELTIFGDITSWPWMESDTSSHTLRQDLEALGPVDEINVHINSYGGEVAEGLAIYNTLKNHQAKVTTFCDGFACSIASVIFMAGDERVMNEASLLMIHNAWTYASGNSEELKKAAEDLGIITDQSKTIYMNNINISRDELTELMDNETWITPEQAIEMGFATSINATDEEDVPSQSARVTVYNKLIENAREDKVSLMEIKEMLETIINKPKEEAEQIVVDNPPDATSWENFF